MTATERRRRFGVDAFFADNRPLAVGVDDLADAKLINLDRIQPDLDQPRKTFDTDRLEELADSIRQQGVLQPIVVRYNEAQDVYIVVHGERRFRATQMAGLQAIPALVREVPAERILLQQLTENVIREDLNAIDRAQALRELKELLGDVPWESVAQAVGIKRSRLFQLLSTGKLSSTSQEDIRSGRLSEKQSRALQGLSPEKEAAFRNLIMQERLPEPVLNRLSRAFRELPLPSDDAEAAAQALGSLKVLLQPAEPSEIRHQTTTLLQAVKRGATGSASDRRRLSQLGKLVGASRFDEHRFGKDLASLTRNLVSLPVERSRRSAEVSEQLKELRDALDALIE